MRVELSDKNPANTNKKHSMATDQLVSVKKDGLTDIDEKAKEKKKIPLFYRIPIYKANKYEFY
jgi:hypothetical protein